MQDTSSTPILANHVFMDLRAQGCCHVGMFCSSSEGKLQTLCQQFAEDPPYACAGQHKLVDKLVAISGWEGGYCLGILLLQVCSKLAFGLAVLLDCSVRPRGSSTLACRKTLTASSFAIPLLTLHITHTHTQPVAGL